MRNVIFGINISIDNCYDHTKFNGDAEVHEYFTNLMDDVDLLIYGRKIYDLMFPYWSDLAKTQSDTTTSNAFATTITAIDKIVFSRTLENVEGNARIIRDNLAEEVQKLKQQPGKKISIAGVSVRSELMAHGLIDEFYFVVHPVIVAQGKRLFDDITFAENLSLKLADIQIFKNGCVALHYLKG